MTELETIVEKSERDILILQKDYERLQAIVSEISSRLERGNKRFDELGMAARLQETTNAGFVTEDSRIHLEIEGLQRDLKASMQAVNTLLNDRILMDIRQLSDKLAGYNDDGSEYGKVTRARVEQIATAVLDDEGKVNKRLKAVEAWQHDLGIRVSLAIGIGAPVWGIIVYLLTRWVAQKFGL